MTENDEKIGGFERPSLQLAGQIDFRNAGEVRNRLIDAVSLSSEVHVDVADVDFIDSSGLSAIIDAARYAGMRGRTIRLIEPSRRLRHMLDITGFCELFAICDTYTSLQTPSGRVAEHVVGSEVSFLLPCRPESLSAVRGRVVEFAKKLPFNEDELADIQLAVGEAVSNAYRHGCSGSQDDIISVRCRISAVGLEVDIKDRGDGFVPSSIIDPVPGVLSTGGRGIFFMRMMVDEVEFTFDGGTCVHLHKWLK